MAEARTEEEEQGERRLQPADYSERTKPDHFLSSQGPLSSIRAAIKRTRTNSQSDHTRDRRRPEITIISAEPLASNNWLPGTSVVFPSPPQPGWSVGIQPVSKPPPSYDQVIKETQEELDIVKPTAAPRQSTCTTTSATQTDPVRVDPGATPQSAKKRSTGKKPQKPPRPTLPKVVDRDRAAGTVGLGDQADSTHTYTRSVTVYWDIPAEHPAQPLSAFVIPAESTPSSSNSKDCERPVPLPRIKSRKQAVKEEEEEEEDQTLVRLSENCEKVKVASGTDPEDVSSNKYLKELLEVFSVENEYKRKVDVDDQSDQASQSEDAGGEMSAAHSQRNIQARIKAFESQAEDGSVLGPAKPEPVPRKTTNRPSIAAKPSIVSKPQFHHSVENDYQNVPTTNSPQAPTPAPRPLPPRKPVGLSVKEELDTLLAKGPTPHRSRPSLLTRANSIHEEETSTAPPTPPVKPAKEPLKPNLNINNHNSTSVTRGSEFVDSLSNHVPVKPQCSVDTNEGSFSRNSVTRRPTTIRVPSRTESLSDHFLDSPPPLPAQRPIGSLNPSVNLKQSLPSTPSLPSQEVFNVVPEPSLPPRRIGTSKKPPPRPPPAKTGPGRPPPPSLRAAGRSHSAPQQASPKPQAHKPHEKGLVLPPRPNPGHRLYNKYTLQLPHGITASDYKGNNKGELSFQKNEVLLLLEEIDHNTFECQVGGTRGRVHKSRMKVITPLDSASNTSPSQCVNPGASGLKVQALHDFTPEGPGELGLRAGDVVSLVERVDGQWYRGTCRGSTGYFPVNFVQVLSDSPNPLPERKVKLPSARVSGPRCVARFDFEGEHSDELSFSEGDVIQLKEYVGQDWARGQIGVFSGIFPLNFVEVVEDLPDKTALPGTITSPSIPAAAELTQASPSTVEWMVALYDFAGKTEGDLSFQQGDCILVTQHLNDEWSCGRLDGREGMFPRAFVESSTAGQQPSDTQQNRGVGGGRGRAMFDFASDCDEELSLKVGDIITNLESIDEEWFLGDLKGKRALVPKNYVQVL